MYMKPCDYCPDRPRCLRYSTTSDAIKSNRAEVRVYSASIQCTKYKARHWPGQRIVIEHETYNEDRSLMDATGTILGWRGYKVRIRLDEKTVRDNWTIFVYPAKQNGVNNLSLSPLAESDRKICPGCGVPEGHIRPSAWEECPCDIMPDKRGFMGNKDWPYPCCAGKVAP